MKEKEFEEYKNRCEEIINFYPTRRQTLLYKRCSKKGTNEAKSYS